MPSTDEVHNVEFFQPLLPPVLYSSLRAHVGWPLRCPYSDPLRTSPHRKRRAYL